MQKASGYDRKCHKYRPLTKRRCREAETQSASNHATVIKQPGPEVIKLEHSLKLKIKRSDWLLANTCPQTANHCAYFELETLLKFYNLEASFLLLSKMIAKLELTLRTTLKTEIKHKTPLQSK